ncbi:hypothetical protein GCM10020331_074640 [Ectobacillus funiculus]
MNASTFAARVVASTESDMVSAVTGAIGAMKGPLHGGAPTGVIDMLNEITKKRKKQNHGFGKKIREKKNISWALDTVSTEHETHGPRHLVRLRNGLGQMIHGLS